MNSKLKYKYTAFKFGSAILFIYTWAAVFASPVEKWVYAQCLQYTQHPHAYLIWRLLLYGRFYCRRLGFAVCSMFNVHDCWTNHVFEEVAAATIAQNIARVAGLRMIDMPQMAHEQIYTLCVMSLLRFIRLVDMKWRTQKQKLRKSATSRHTHDCITWKLNSDFHPQSLSVGQTTSSQCMLIRIVRNNSTQDRNGAAAVAKQHPMNINISLGDA